MNKITASIGVVLVLLAGLLFLITFSGGTFLGITVTGTDPTANFLAFLFVIIFLPVGSGLAFFGFAYRRPMLAAGTAQQVVYKGSPGVARAALALAVIALLIAVGAFAMLFTTSGAQTSNINNLTSQLNALTGKVSGQASLNTQPSTIAYRVDWSNTDPTGQDRFVPSVIVVPQGDIVQIMFEHNDTDAHTFTMYTSTTAYGFQINDTYVGMRDFLNNNTYTGSCVNGTYTQDTTGLTANGVSTVYCVSGSSLLQPTSTSFFKITPNPNPGSPLGIPSNPSPQPLLVDNRVYVNPSTNISAGIVEIFGVGAFQASTPGVFEFFCDYHVSNGMFGYLVVLPNAACN